MNNYSASGKDLKTIEEGISYIWHPKLDFIFKDKEKIKDVLVISYDDSNFYVWKHKISKIKVLNSTIRPCSLSDYESFIVPHNIKIKKNNLLGWRLGFTFNEKIPLENLVKVSNEDKCYFNVVSGSLLTQFIKAQKQKQKNMAILNPYLTYESYLATIVHEFGHAYFENNLTSWFSDKKENIRYLNDALKLYENGNFSKIKMLNFPNYDRRSSLLSETFAFCTDYSAASIFWENHKKDIDTANKKNIKNLLEDENKKDVRVEYSVLDPNPYSHNAALVIGKILLTKFPQIWPESILGLNYLI